MGNVIGQAQFRAVGAGQNHSAEDLRAGKKAGNLVDNGPRPLQAGILVHHQQVVTLDVADGNGLHIAADNFLHILQRRCGKGLHPHIAVGGNYKSSHHFLSSSHKIPRALSLISISSIRSLASGRSIKA